MSFLSSQTARLGARRGPPRRADYDLPTGATRGWPMGRRGERFTLPERQAYWPPFFSNPASRQLFRISPARYDPNGNSILGPIWSQ